MNKQERDLDNLRIAQGLDQYLSYLKQEHPGAACEIEGTKRRLFALATLYCGLLEPSQTASAITKVATSQMGEA